MGPASTGKAALRSLPSQLKLIPTSSNPQRKTRIHSRYSSKLPANSKDIDLDGAETTFRLSEEFRIVFEGCCSKVSVCVPRPQSSKHGIDCNSASEAPLQAESDDFYELLGRNRAKRPQARR